MGTKITPQGTLDYSLFGDLTHIPRSARKTFVDNYLNKYDYRLTNRRPAYELWNDETTFKDLLRDNRLDLGADRAFRHKRLGNLRFAISLVMECLYEYCPVDTGFGLTHGIRYELTTEGAKIVIGRGIAEYLVHLSYPRTGNRREAVEHRHWIPRALAEARPLVKEYGYKLMQDHLRYGSMQVYLVKE